MSKKLMSVATLALAAFVAWPSHASEEITLADEHAYGDENLRPGGPGRPGPGRPPGRPPGPGRPGPGRPPGPPRPPRPPQPSYNFIGQMQAGNPMSWDRDTVQSNTFGRWYGVVFELDRGVSVDIANLIVTCYGGHVCYRSPIRDVVDFGRRAWVDFGYGLDVQTVTLDLRPNGVSIPPSRVNVFLYR